MKKICVVTATRAEYGLLKPLMDRILQSEGLELQIIATGAHLSPEFGLTYKHIEADGFFIHEKVEILLSSDTPTSIVKTMALAMNGMADVFPRLRPDLLVILGDRYEMLAIASAATIFKVPIAHLHGGEITEGAYDDAIRHAITKLSHLHFASTDEYRNRIIQMGEDPLHVYNFGAIGLDNIVSLPLLSKEELEDSLGIRFRKYNYQVTFHPETLSEMTSQEQFDVLLNALQEQEDSYFVFTKANADTDGRVINQMIDRFVSENPEKASAYSSLGTIRFLSLVNICDAIVGNSSSGIIEAPSLKTPTINIGNRQRGRTQADSILNATICKKSILACFEKIKDSEFRNKIGNTINPYGNGGTAERILSVLTAIESDKFKTKAFFNLQL